ISDAQNNVTALLGGVEDAGAITEAAGFVAKLTHLSVFQIERKNRFDGFRNFLAVRSDILYRRAADASGDAAQAFDSGAIARDRLRNKAIPLLACTHLENFLTVFIAPVNSSNSHLEDESRPARVRDHQIAAASKYE